MVIFSNIESDIFATFALAGDKVNADITVKVSATCP
jgi:hypothetical protein